MEKIFIFFNNKFHSLHFACHAHIILLTFICIIYFFHLRTPLASDYLYFVRHFSFKIWAQSSSAQIVKSSPLINAPVFRSIVRIMAIIFWDEGGGSIQSSPLKQALLACT